MKSGFRYMSLAFVAAMAMFGNAVAKAQTVDGSGDDDPTVLVIHLNDDSMDAYELPDKPEVTFADGMVNISSKNINTSYELNKVTHFDFRLKSQYENSGSIVLPAYEKTGMTLSYIDNNTVVISADGLTTVYLYDMKGLKLSTLNAVDGVATVSLSEFVPGTYIIAPEGHNAVKIVKR